MTDLLRYVRMVERALRGVLRETLVQVGRHGLPGNHHLYITFRTDHPDVRLAEHLRAKYPNEMTIVIQYQFWDLELDEAAFAVSLSFNDVRERLYIPFEAVTAFADPSVSFGLQFQQTPAESAETDAAERSEEHTSELQSLM